MMYMMEYLKKRVQSELKKKGFVLLNDDGLEDEIAENAFLRPSFSSNKKLSTTDENKVISEVVEYYRRMYEQNC